MYCCKCGTALAEGSNFCHHCGAAAEPAVNPRKEMTEPAVANAPADENLEESYVVTDEATAAAESAPVPKAPENASSYFVESPVEKKESTPKERQSLLDRINAKIKAESIIWRVFAILNIVAYVSMWVGLFVSISIASTYGISLDDDAYDEYSYDEYYYDDPAADYTVAMSEEDMEFYSDLLYILYGVSLLGATFGIYAYAPSVIVGFIMAKKADNCRRKLYEDCTVAYSRYSSPGPIILGALFNRWTLFCTIPLVVITKNNSKMLMEIAEIQRNYFGTNC